MKTETQKNCLHVKIFQPFNPPPPPPTPPPPPPPPLHTLRQTNNGLWFFPAYIFIEGKVLNP